MDKALIEIGFILHTGVCGRTYIPFSMSPDVPFNIVVATVAALNHEFVGKCNLLVDVTNQQYVKNRTGRTGEMHDEVLSLVNAFPLIPLTTLVREYNHDPAHY